MYGIVTITICVLIVLEHCNTGVNAGMCADENWYYNMVKLRCKPCTVCLEELGEMELTPCDELHDRVCIPAFEDIKSPITTKTPDVVTFPDFDPEDDDIFSSEKSLPLLPGLVTEKDFLDPLEEQQAIIDYQAQKLSQWKFTAFGLAALLGLAAIVIVILIACICSGQHHGMQSVSMHKDDLEKGGKNEDLDLEMDDLEFDLDGDYGTLRRSRLFSRGLLSSSDFLRGLSTYEKKGESQEGLFDQTIYPPPNMYSQHGSCEDVFPDNNNVTETLIHSRDSGLSSNESPSTSKGNIVAHEDKYSISGMRMNDPVIGTQPPFPDFIQPDISRNEKKGIVTHWSNGRAVSVSTSRSFDI